MFRLEEVIQLKDDEVIRMVTKRHAITIVPKLMLAFVLIVLPFFFLFPLFSTGPTGVVVFLVFVIVGLIIACRTFVMWDGDAFIISNLRVVKVTQTGIFSRTVNEVAAESLKEASWGKNGVLGHMFNYGSIRIGNAEAFEARYVPNPKDVHALLIEIMDEARKRGKKEPDRQARVERVQKLMEDLDDKTLLNIERGLKTGEREDAIKNLFGGRLSEASGQQTTHSSSDSSGQAPHRQQTVPKENESPVVSEITVKNITGAGLKPLDE